MSRRSLREKGSCFLKRGRYALLLLMTVIVITAGLSLGFVSISLAQMGSLLWKWCTALPFTAEETFLWDMVVTLRLPRVLLAFAVGMGLTLSGAVMQAVVQNPLADPYILGISAGASLGAAGAIFLGAGDLWGAEAIGVCACMGAVAVTGLVLGLAKIGGRMQPGRLLLCGMALHAVCAGLSGFLVYAGRNKAGMESLTYWMMGSVANARTEQVLVLLVIVGAAALYILRQHRVLDILLLGEEEAVTLGVAVRSYVWRYVLVSSIVVGFVVYNAGMIGFVGLMVPHAVRSLLGSCHRRYLGTALWTGGIAAVVMDIASRTAVPGVEVPIGVLFAFLGAPCFFYLVLRKKYRFGGV